MIERKMRLETVGLGEGGYTIVMPCCNSTRRGLIQLILSHKSYRAKVHRYPNSALHIGRSTEIKLIRKMCQYCVCTIFDENLQNS